MLYIHHETTFNNIPLIFKYCLPSSIQQHVYLESKHLQYFIPILISLPTCLIWSQTRSVQSYLRMLRTELLSTSCLRSVCFSSCQALSALTACQYVSLNHHICPPPPFHQVMITRNYVL